MLEELENWEPAPPKVTFEYDERNLPDWLLRQSVRRDKTEIDLLRWNPGASSRPVAESLKKFLDEFGEKITEIGFKRLWLNGNIY